MSSWEVLAVVVAAVWAGTINTVVGSGTLVTFPTLLALGVPPVTANISNSVGLVAGGLTGTWGYRRELAGTGRALARLVPMSVLGAITGALLLLVLPEEAFAAIVPVLIGLGVLLVILGPRLSRASAARAARRAGEGSEGVASGRGQALALALGVLAAGVYGGYFGAAQGVILMGLLSAASTASIQQLNGVKNVLGTVVNAVGSLVFIIVSPELLDWRIAGLVAAGALVGGIIGAKVGRRLPPTALRAVIVVIGLIGIVTMVRP